MKFLRYLWASPATLAGLVAALPCVLAGARCRVVDGALEFAGGALMRLVGRAPTALRFAAITLGHVIIGLDSRGLDNCRAHEHVHVRQYERWGVLFFPLYLASSAWQWARRRDPYRDNVFEREAFRATPPPGGG
jgi:hypothetical protein